MQTPLSLTDYLLSHLAQECAEVIVRITKAQHFGLDEIQPEQDFTNRQRILFELCDLLAMAEVLREENILPTVPADVAERRLAAKKLKAAKFREYSKELGRLS